LAFGEEDEPKRLFVLAAGNCDDQEAWAEYPVHLDTEEIHDPGQSWNALTVGACTDRWRIDERDFTEWTPVGQPGDLSPCTTTSTTWAKPWPLKPDVVCEGGNVARSPDGNQFDTLDSLSLLTTFHRPTERQLTAFGDTSASSALVTRLAGTLQSHYPELWPETIRALIVHSASWTRAMEVRFGPLRTKGDYERLIRQCGFGIPSLERALWSAENRLTLIAQEHTRPFDEKGTRVNLKELQVYEFPWPIEALRELQEIQVELRVTLSYFIEPNPSERGHASRHSYQSHGLRFDVRGATETLSNFKKRLNKAARQEGERSPRGSDPSGWLVGSDARHRGSIHTDTWRGTAVDLANRQHLAVYPVTGWWKERKHLERWRRTIRYALVISIHAPEVDVDLYTPVMTAIGIPIEV
jgi:hypothetical protein